jgi:uncharacterized membrane protein YedE/YeeE
VKMQPVAALLAGVVFGFGLVLSGMTEPGNVIAFLNLAPGWSPALMVVMVAALVVTAIGYRLAGARSAPLFDADFHAPASTQIDRRLLVGAALFGLGWGIAGYCPGPAIVGAFTFDTRALLFIGAYVAGMLLFEWWDTRVRARAASADG